MSAPNENNVSQPQVIHILNETSNLCLLVFLLNCYRELYASVLSEGFVISGYRMFLSFFPLLSAHVFDELLDSIIMDVASECHRITKLGLDRNLEEEEEELRLSAQARARVADPSNSSETNGKYIVDIFGQTHPPVANEIFECMNCGRSIMAGRFAPHLEKCMGKGRKARLKATRSSTAQNRYTRRNSASTYSPYSNPTSTSRLPNGSSGVSGHEYSNGSLEEM
ncbi:putative 6-phosphofructo-2-kinase/fructose-2,6-bisphosphatase-like [Capsicum annuum]|nr:putative 6-phosphofructo-2-kinase/fructose-2,6-bisphosphatase-like [Capsicum annuum]